MVTNSVIVEPERRPLSVRVKVLADRFSAIASGHEKQALASAQAAGNARRDAAWLYEAVEVIRAAGR